MHIELWTIATTLADRHSPEAARIERDRWYGMFMPDTQSVLGDAYVALAAAANATSTMRLGTGMTNTRLLVPTAVAASAIATVQRLSGRHAIFRIDSGDASLAHLGLAPASIYAVFEEYLEPGIWPSSWRRCCNSLPHQLELGRSVETLA